MAGEAPFIIVVDDDHDSLEIIKHILEAHGFRAACFVDPLEALERMAQEKPRLVITDLIMKALDTGFSFSRQIKFDPRFRDVPVILVTAALSQRGLAVQPRNPQDLERMRVDAYFDKPVDSKALVCKVRELLQGRPEDEQP